MRVPSLILAIMRSRTSPQQLQTVTTRLAFLKMLGKQIYSLWSYLRMDTNELGGVSLSFWSSTGGWDREATKVQIENFCSWVELVAEHYARVGLNKGTSKCHQLASKCRKPLEGIPRNRPTYIYVCACVMSRKVEFRVIVNYYIPMKIFKYEIMMT